MTEAPVVVSFKHCIYPAYLDSTKTIPGGRRLPKAACVANPNITDIAEACKTLGIPCLVEDKAYPRDWLVRGRLRFNESSELPSKPLIMKRICEIIAQSRSAVPSQPSSSSQPKKKGKK